MDARRYELGPGEAGQRLDRLLRRLLHEVPLGAIFRLMRQGAVRLDGARAKPDQRLAEGMVLELRLPAAELARLPASLQAPGAPSASRDPAPGRNGPLGRAAAPGRAGRGAATGPTPAARLVPAVVHRDADVLVVDKPAGLPVQPGSGSDWNLCAWLATQPFGQATAVFTPAPAHRLDRDTSGLVAIGLSPAGLRGLAAAFRDGTAQKIYFALVAGRPPAERGTIDVPLRVLERVAADRPKAVVDAAGLPARTDYEVVACGQRRTLLRLVLHSGRTHQIRAHLAHLGLPIVGDRRYGASDRSPERRLCLHAAELALAHPVTGAALAWSSPWPAVWRAALR